MAHFTRTRANLAAWAAGTTLLDTEIDNIDGQTYAAINGDGGGVWAPSAAIEIGGSGLKLTGANHSVDGGSAFLTFKNGADLNIGDASNASLAVIWNASELRIENGGSFAVRPGGSMAVQSTGAVAFQSGSSVTNASANWTISGTSKFTYQTGTEIELASGSTLDVDGAATFDGASVFNGSAGTTTFSGTTTFDATSTVTCAGSTALGGTPNLTAPLSVTSTGRVRGRVYYNTATDADLVLGINDGTHLINASGVFTGNHLLTLSTTGAGDGDLIEVSNLDATRTLTCNSVPLLNAAGSTQSAVWWYRAASGAWILIKRHGYN